MADKDNQNNHDQEQDEEIVELTEVLEEGDVEEPLIEEPIESAEEEKQEQEELELSPESDAESDESPEVIASELAEDESDSNQDMDFDALFEELEHEPEPKDADRSEEYTSKGVSLSPEDEGKVTGGIYTPDDEADFDALLEDLDKQDDMLPIWEESEESEEIPGEESPDVTDQAGEKREIEDESVSVGEPEEPETEDKETDLEGDAAPQEIAPESEVDPSELAERLQRLENEHQRPRIQEEDLARALSSLSPDSDVWGGLEERLQQVMEQKIREHTGDMESRIADLQAKVDSMASGDFVSRQALDQQVRDLQAEIPSRQELEELKQTLRTELVQELESRIPAAAASIIREEIENLRSGSEE